ncbi:MAG: ComF family protein [Anaerolineae bacterium]|nr:ComF family protein [Anaerolineae bacterium]
MNLSSVVISPPRRAFMLLLDLLYPPRCGGCDKPGEGWWCTACNKRTHWLDMRDSRASLTLPSGESLTVISAAMFTSPLREGIHRFKYEGQPQLAAAFAAPMSAIWLAHGMQADVIVAVPLHTTRLRERGFNQSLLLAHHASLAMGIPVEPHALRRIRRTEQQAHLDLPARQENVRGAFAAQPQLAGGKAIVLLDDVFTTGATLSECASALYQAGARSVIALTLARA